jgi:hypothetical protein
MSRDDLLFQYSPFLTQNIWAVYDKVKLCNEEKQEKSSSRVAGYFSQTFVLNATVFNTTLCKLRLILMLYTL